MPTHPTSTKHKPRCTHRGVTPNPDVLCNREIKFAHFLRFAVDRLQAPLIATGHYARLAHGGEAYQDDPQEAERPLPQLLAGVDEGKDQSYFLSHVPTDAFRRVLFPLGGLRKAEVRVWLDSLSIPSNTILSLPSSESASAVLPEASVHSFLSPPNKRTQTHTIASHDDKTTQVRALAKAAGLCTAERRESMGICFVGKRRCVLRVACGYLCMCYRPTRRGSCAPLSPIVTIITTLLP